jgi:hypothetical protein
MKPSREALQARIWAWLGPGFPGPAWPGSGLLSQARTSLVVEFSLKFVEVDTVSSGQKSTYDLEVFLCEHSTMPRLKGVRVIGRERHGLV